VRLTAGVVYALKRHSARQGQEIVSMDTLYRDQGLVFASGIGTPLNRYNLNSRSFKPLLKRAGLPEIRFHDLRHTCATLLLSRDVHPKFVQELLGHATIAITLDTYSHVLPGMGDHASRAMEDALS
jgi:integrase